MQRVAREKLRTRHEAISDGYAVWVRWGENMVHTDSTGRSSIQGTLSHNFEGSQGQAGYFEGERILRSAESSDTEQAERWGRTPPSPGPASVKPNGASRTLGQRTAAEMLAVR